MVMKSCFFNFVYEMYYYDKSIISNVCYCIPFATRKTILRNLFDNLVSRQHMYIFLVDVRFPICKYKFSK